MGCTIDPLLSSEQNSVLAAYASGQEVEVEATFGANLPDNDVNEICHLEDDDECGEGKAKNGHTTETATDTDVLSATTSNGSV